MRVNQDVLKGPSPPAANTQLLLRLRYLATPRGFCHGASIVLQEKNTGACIIWYVSGNVCCEFVKMPFVEAH